MAKDHATVNWSSFTELSEEDARAHLRPVLEAVDETLGHDAQLPVTLARVLDEGLEGPIDAETFAKVLEPMQTLFGMGDDMAHLLSWLAADHPGRVNAVAPLGPPATERLLRDVFAVYGQRLSESYRRWREIPDDWESLYHQVQYEFETGRYVVGIGIQKLNGETAWIRGSAGSILALASNLVRTLNQIAARGPFEASRVEEFRGVLNDFWQEIEAGLRTIGQGSDHETASAQSISADSSSVR